MGGFPSGLAPRVSGRLLGRLPEVLPVGAPPQGRAGEPGQRARLPCRLARSSVAPLSQAGQDETVSGAGPCGAGPQPMLFRGQPWKIWDTGALPPWVLRSERKFWSRLNRFFPRIGLDTHTLVTSPSHIPWHIHCTLPVGIVKL